MYVTVNQKANIIIDIMEYVVFVGLCKILFNIVVLCINKYCYWSNEPFLCSVITILICSGIISNIILRVFTIL